MSAAGGGTIGLRIRISRPDGGAQDAALQERGLRAEISSAHAAVYNTFNVDAISRQLNHTPRAPRRGDDHGPRGRRGRMKIRTSYSPLALFTCQRDDAPKIPPRRAPRTQQR